MIRKAQPNLLRLINERAVFERVRRHGLTSRSELKRVLGVSAPTISKAVARLVEAGFLEEVGIAPGNRMGRPGMVYRLARGRVQVLGALLGVRQVTVVAASLDGDIAPENILTYEMPDSYAALIGRIATAARRLMHKPGVETLGLGISTPGGIDVRAQRVISSPNLHMLDGQSPSQDLSEKLGIDVTMFHDTVGAALAAMHYGAARDLTDFVLLGVYEGFGTSVVSGGRIIEGHDGLGGEFGHIVVDPNGPACGCGNRGCLETLGTDAAFARAVSSRVGRTLTVDDILKLVQGEKLDVRKELDRTLSYLATGIGAAINVFNPQAVLITSRMLDVAPDAFDRLRSLVGRRTLPALLSRCQVERIRPKPELNAVAGILRHLTETLGPTVS